MKDYTTLEHLRNHEIPERVTVVKGSGDLPKIDVETDWSTAEIYLLGAHVTGFQKNGEPPLLFLSRRASSPSASLSAAACRLCFPGSARAKAFRVTDLPE